jgi:hypothetical protein
MADGYSQNNEPFDIFGSDPLGRNYVYGLFGNGNGQGIAPYGIRYAENLSQPTTAKRGGYFGNIGTINEPMTELSSSFDIGGKTVQYPLIVPTLTSDELNLLRSGGEPTPEIINKAEKFAMSRLSRGQDPFATTQDLRYPQPENSNNKFLNKTENGLFNSNTTTQQESTGSISNNLIDFLLQRFNAQLFPTAAKTLIETVQGNKTPITEKNFTPEELIALKKLIDITGNRGNVQYEDYLNLMKKEQQEKGTIPMSINPSLLSVLDPIGNVQTTLGRFTYTRDANGNLVVVDKYDFNPIPSFSGAYGAIRNYAGEKIPRGSGREVMINLGNADPFGNTIGSSIR